MSLDRLQKVIARSGFYSRRSAEALIRKGLVTVDGVKVTALGLKVDPAFSRITVKGRLLYPKGLSQYLLLHKPRKCVVTRIDPEGRKTVYHLLPKELHHLRPVGRLDYHTEGLLLMTNDGDLAQRMTHPRYAIRKVYEVKVKPKPGRRQMERLAKGILLDGRVTLPAEVKLIRENPRSSWIRIALQEGRNRQVRRMCEKVGLNVATLIRTSMGPLQLKGIPYGGWRLLRGPPADFGH